MLPRSTRRRKWLRRTKPSCNPLPSLLKPANHGRHFLLWNDGRARFLSDGPSFKFPKVREARTSEGCLESRKPTIMAHRTVLFGESSTGARASLNYGHRKEDWRTRAGTLAAFARATARIHGIGSH